MKNMYSLYQVAINNWLCGFENSYIKYFDIGGTAVTKEQKCLILLQACRADEIY